MKARVFGVWCYANFPRAPHASFAFRFLARIFVEGPTLLRTSNVSGLRERPPLEKLQIIPIIANTWRRDIPFELLPVQITQVVFFMGDKFGLAVFGGDGLEARCAD